MYPLPSQSFPHVERSFVPFSSSFLPPSALPSLEPAELFLIVLHAFCRMYKDTCYQYTLPYAHTRVCSFHASSDCFLYPMRTIHSSWLWPTWWTVTHQGNQKRAILLQGNGQEIDSNTIKVSLGSLNPPLPSSRQLQTARLKDKLTSSFTMKTGSRIFLF